MERVLFITTETGADLILSFAVQQPDDPSAIESLSLIRTPKYEFILEEHERGVKVSFERFPASQDELLQSFDYAAVDAVVRIRTSSRHYKLDLRKTDADDLEQMRQVLKLMNFDRKFLLTGA